MKRRMIMILVAAMLLFGCGSSEEEQKKDATNSESVQDIEIEVTEEETEDVKEIEEAEEVEQTEQEQEKVQEPEVDIAAVKKMLDDAEAKAAELEKKLEEDASLTQYDMNELSHEIYVVWDDVLNDVWGILKDTLDEDTMNSLLEEQREWIADKEEEANAAGEEFAGGSMQAMVVNQKAAELTQIRVYELAAYLGVGNN